MPHQVFKKGKAMRRIVPFLLVTMVVVGCNARLNDVGTVNIDPGEQKYKMVEAIRNEQTIKVSGAATAGNFNIFVFLEKDQAEVENDLKLGKKPAKAIAQMTKTDKADLRASIPANNVAVVMLMSADNRKAAVNLKITN